MSQSLPVGAVLNEAFQFGLQRWGTMIRFAWAPLLVGCLLIAGFLGLMLNVEAIMEAGRTGASGEASEYLRLPAPMIFLFSLVLYVLVSVLFSGIMASVFRLVALGEDENRLVNIRLDGPAARVFWASLIKGVISTFIWCGALAIALVLTGKNINAFFGDLGGLFSAAVSSLALAISGAPDAGAERFATAEALFITTYWKTVIYSLVIALVPALYISVRLAPFVAGSAAENRLILMGSFELTRERFWPVLGAMILMGLMVFVISIIFELVSQIMELLSGLGAAGGVFALIALVVGIIHLGLMIFYNAVVYGAQFALSAIIYRRLKTGV